MTRNSFKRMTRAASVLVLAGAMTSCMTGPDYKRPDLKTPALYKSATAADAAEPGLALDWWKLFNDPDLTALEEEALRANQDLKAAMARVAQARASASSVKSEFFPVVTMNPSATRSRRPGTETSDSDSTEEKINQLTSVVNKVSSLVGSVSSLASGTSTGSSSSGSSSTTGSLGSSLLQSGTTSTTTTGSAATIGNSYSIPFDLSYEIDIWGRVRRSYESARAEIRASEYNFEVVRQTLLADVAQNYFNLRAFDTQDKILAENLTLYQEQVDLTQNKVQAGLTEVTDLLQAKVQLESARAEAANIRRQRADVVHAIAILLGRAPADFALEERPLEGTPPVIPAGMPGDVLKRRPDVAEAEQDLASACAEIGVAKAEFFPTVKLTGTAGFESSDFKDVLDWSNRVWSIGPSVSLPIFEGGKLKASLRQAKARYDELEAVYRNTVLAAFGDVEDSLTDLHLRADQADAQSKSVEAAREYHKLTKIQYDTGIVDYLQLVDAERTLLDNELSAVKILNERMISTVLLVKSIGGGWDSQTATPVDTGKPSTWGPDKTAAKQAKE
ncbi:MAG: efflux transporter outer membrane subunit [Candidatus Hydrogenedentales bacterium]|jgi:NodT family efflux transporter outer membrane factor (OMF) lipoprotein